VVRAQRIKARFYTSWSLIIGKPYLAEKALKSYFCQINRPTINRPMRAFSLGRHLVWKLTYFAVCTAHAAYLQVHVR